MTHTQSKIKYMHWYTLDENDFYEMFNDALKCSKAFDGLVRFFKENKKWLQVLINEVGENQQ